VPGTPETARLQELPRSGSPRVHSWAPPPLRLPLAATPWCGTRGCDQSTCWERGTESPAARLAEPPAVAPRHSGLSRLAAKVSRRAGGNWASFDQTQLICTDIYVQSTDASVLSPVNGGSSIATVRSAPKARCVVSHCVRALPLGAQAPVPSSSLPVTWLLGAPAGGIPPGANPVAGGRASSRSLLPAQLASSLPQLSSYHRHRVQPGQHSAVPEARRWPHHDH
jgi:hypothetical protein